MTEREKEIYIYICDYLKIHKYPPSIRDISRFLHISVTVVKKHLNNMVDKGVLENTPHIARSYVPK